jgi:hypothetical protein
MDTDVFSARVDTDQEEVARLIREADLLAIPIVDSEDRLVGIVTVDDAMEVLEREESEDLAAARRLASAYLHVLVLAQAAPQVEARVPLVERLGVPLAAVGGRAGLSHGNDTMGEIRAGPCNTTADVALRQSREMQRRSCRREIGMTKPVLADASGIFHSSCGTR